MASKHALDATTNSRSDDEASCKFNLRATGFNLAGSPPFSFTQLKSLTNTEWLVAQAYVSFNSFRRRTADRTEAAAVVEYTQAPPATVFLQALQFQMPTQFLFIDCFPQKVQVYLECWVTSIFFTILRREAPYRVPYFPTTPTFLVRFACGKVHVNERGD